MADPGRTAAAQTSVFELCGLTGHPADGAVFSRCVVAASAAGLEGRLTELLPLAAIHESSPDVLLKIQVVLGDALQGTAKGRQLLDAFEVAVVADIVGSQFGAPQPVLAGVLLQGNSREAALLRAACPVQVDYVLLPDS